MAAGRLSRSAVFLRKPSVAGAADRLLCPQGAAAPVIGRRDRARMAEHTGVCFSRGSHVTRTVALLAAGLACLMTLAGCSSSDPDAKPEAAAGDGVRHNPVVAGRRSRVFVMAGFGEKCESLAAPNLAVTQPPQKGDVSFEPGQETTVTTSASGTCIGSRVAGTGIYYTARPGQTGSDTFSVEAELGGSVTQRTFTVEIVE